MSDTLEEDAQYEMYRIRLRNLGGGIGQFQVDVEEVVDENRVPVIQEALLPIELQWSHQQPRGARQGLSKHTAGGTVALVMVVERNGIPRLPPYLVLTGAGPDVQIPDHLSSGQRTVFFRVRAILPGTRKSVTRWFWLRPDSGAALEYQAGTGPPAGDDTRR